MRLCWWKATEQWLRETWQKDVRAWRETESTTEKFLEDWAVCTIVPGFQTQKPFPSLVFQQEWKNIAKRNIPLLLLIFFFFFTFSVHQLSSFSRFNLILASMFSALHFMCAARPQNRQNFVVPLLLFLYFCLAWDPGNIQKGN